MKDKLEEIQIELTKILEYINRQIYLCKKEYLNITHPKNITDNINSHHIKIHIALLNSLKKRLEPLIDQKEIETRYITKGD